MTADANACEDEGEVYLYSGLCEDKGEVYLYSGLCEDEGEVYLYSGLCEADLDGELLPGEDVRVVCPGECLFQLL